MTVNYKRKCGTRRKEEETGGYTIIDWDINRTDRNHRFGPFIVNALFTLQRQSCVRLLYRDFVSCLVSKWKYVYIYVHVSVYAYVRRWFVQLEQTTAFILKMRLTRSMIYDLAYLQFYFCFIIIIIIMLHCISNFIMIMYTSLCSSVLFLIYKYRNIEINSLYNTLWSVCKSTDKDIYIIECNTWFLNVICNFFCNYIHIMQ